MIALEGVEFVKHSGNISYFRKEYIKTGIFDVELSDIITKAFTIRSGSDYDDFYVVFKEETRKQIENAALFCDQIKSDLAGKS